MFALFICSFSLVCRWVPIKGNDWFWIRHFIRVGMHVIVEITVLFRRTSLLHVKWQSCMLMFLLLFLFQAKRDPYRFRFPLELRFVHPNIDHMMYAIHTSLFSFFFFVFLSSGFGSYNVFFPNLASALISLTFHQYSIAMGILTQMRYGLVKSFLQMSFVSCSLYASPFISYIHPVQRDCGRPPEPRKDPGSKPEEEGLLSDHPYVDKVSVGYELAL